MTGRHGARNIATREGNAGPWEPPADCHKQQCPRCGLDFAHPNKGVAVEICMVCHPRGWPHGRAAHTSAQPSTATTTLAVALAARSYGVSPGDVTGPDKGCRPVQDARGLACWLLRRLGATDAVIAVAMDRTVSGAGESARRMDKAMRADPALAARAEALLRELAAAP